MENGPDRRKKGAHSASYVRQAGVRSPAGGRKRHYFISRRLMRKREEGEERSKGESRL